MASPVPPSQDPRPSQPVQPGRPIAPAHGVPLVGGVPQSDLSTPSARPRGLFSRFGSEFLWISVALHLLLGVAATYYIVQTITAKRKLTFSQAPPSTNRSQQVTEHKVQMVKKQHMMSSPASAKRVTTVGVSKVSLPEMPDAPAMAGPTTKMAGMAGTAGTMGAAPSQMAAGGGGGGGPVPFFGFSKQSTGGALEGTFYDLKQTPNRQPTGMNTDKWKVFVQAWVKGPWDENALKAYYAGPRPLYAPFIFIPIINANMGPKAFNLQDKVQPKLWLAHYKGKVIPPQSGRFRFAGYGDDILIIRFNGKVVLNQHDKNALADPQVSYSYKNLKDRGPRAGLWFEVSAGNSYDMEVLIGECPGGLMHAYTLLEKAGATYEKDPDGIPILPIFRVANVAPSEMSGQEIKEQGGGKETSIIGRHPPFSTKEAPWAVAAKTNSFFSH